MMAKDTVPEAAPAPEAEPIAAPEAAPVKTKARGRRFAVMFQENRTFELYVGRRMWRFSPYQEILLEEEVVKHPDFIQVSSLFSTREVV